MNTGITQNELAMVLSGGKGENLKESWRIVKQIWECRTIGDKCKTCGSENLIEDPEGRPYSTCADCGEKYIILEG